MKKFWSKKQQVDGPPDAVEVAAGAHSSPAAQGMAPKRKTKSCWSGSPAAGEAETMSALPPTTIGTKQGALAHMTPIGKHEAAAVPSVKLAGNNTVPPSSSPLIKSTWFGMSPRAVQQQPAQQQQVQKQQAAQRPNFSATPILGTHGDQIANVAGRMGNIVANCMAAGFGATLGSRAAHSIWNGMTRR